MSEHRLTTYFDDKKKWIVIFLLTFLAFYYWLPPEVPLFYSQALPEDKLTSRYYLLVIPLGVLVFHYVCDWFLEPLALKNSSMERLIKLFKIGLSILSYIIFLKIIILVI